jgi:phosphonate transport system substrate-binding protein
VLWTTESFTPHAFAVNPRVTDKVSQALAQVMTKMIVDPAAAEILHNLNMKGWDLAADKDWDDLRNLHVDIKDAPVQQ